jgi:hypothetical protein
MPKAQIEQVVQADAPLVEAKVPDPQAVHTPAIEAPANEL